MKHKKSFKNVLKNALSLRLVKSRSQARNGTVYSLFPFGITIIQVPAEKWENMFTFGDFGIVGAINVFIKK